jgi:Family of unknown function (DUF5990)
MAAHFRIVGTDLPGRSCGPAPEHPEPYAHVHVGLQRTAEVVDVVPADADRALFEFDVDVDTERGRFTGPYVHGRDGQRFIYLSWGELIDGEFRMFRRAKLHIDHLDPRAVDGRAVVGELGLRDAKGNPLCASVRPPRITWTIGNTARATRGR